MLQFLRKQSQSFFIRAVVIVIILVFMGFGVGTNLMNRQEAAIIFNGEEISKKKPHEIPRLGIARTFQNIELFHGMTTLDNILLGCHID